MSNQDRLFFLNLGRPSRLMSIDTDGGDCRVIDPDLGVAPDGIAIDRGRQRLFWTSMGTEHDGEDFFAEDGSLFSADLDGSNRRTIIPVGATTTPKQMQCDERNGFLYWCDREGMRVMRSRLDGSEITTLVRTGSSAEDKYDRRRHCVGIAVDTAASFLYWTQKGPPNGGEGRILRAPLELPPGMDPGRRTDIDTIFDKLPEPIDLEWDETKGELYWTDRGDPPGGNTLNRARIGAGGASDRAIVTSGLKEAIGVALDRRGRRAFVTDLGGSIRRFELDGSGTSETIYSGHGPITGIAFLPA